MADSRSLPDHCGVVMEHVEGEYRCSACGHGERLQACAEAIVSGMLLSNGDVTQDDVSQTVLCESSIDCLDHQGGAPLERWIGGRWTRWRVCEYVSSYRRCDDGKLFVDGRFAGHCPSCHGAGGFNVPVDSATSDEEGQSRG